MMKIWHIARWPLAVIFILFVALVIYRIPVVEERQKTQEVVKKIHAQRITLADVLGQRLPPEPDSVYKDATVEGIDANGNGIRDDVELAIFKLHPDSSRIRAAELQYALTEQMYFTNVFNSETWKAVAERDDRAYQCVNSVYSYPNFNFSKPRVEPGFYTTEVENLIRNNNERGNRFQEVLKFSTSFGLPPGDVCDIDLAKLLN